MFRLKIFVVAVLVVICLASAGHATAKFTCNAGGRFWEVTPGMWPIEVTMMVTKAGTDCDILVDDFEGTILALGISIESRFETVRFGPLPGVPVRITAIKSSGGNSKAYLRANDSARFIAVRQGDAVRSPVSARELARKDPDYARVLETWDRYQRLKAPLAEAAE
ncbi:MAG: hypothetical protein GY769_07425 [bacterium]|nr:hypothetical protein [bacterium]